jgi:hypothetical protein
LFRKLTGGSKLPPYDIIENCTINCNLYFIFFIYIAHPGK